MMTRSKLISTIVLVAMSSVAYGQSDHYDNSGKIYAVVAVVAITLLGIAAFLIYLERRIKNIEQKLEG